VCKRSSAYNSHDPWSCQDSFFVETAMAHSLTNLGDSPSAPTTVDGWPILPIPLAPEPVPVAFTDDGWPILYEDEELDEMGEANLHVSADEIVHVGIKAHLRKHHPDCRAYSNMNLYYRDGPPHPRTGSPPYVSPDIMIVRPFQPLPETQVSYKIDRDGPAPLSITEILSRRSGQQQDLNHKLTLYAGMKIPEYLLIDPMSLFLHSPLLMKRLQPDGTWIDIVDLDGGVTSALGFRLIFRDDGLHVVDALSGQTYVRPDDAEGVAEELRAAQERIRRLEEELTNLKPS
jgi:hypothetical protein